jgi:hypothetical protein
MSTDTLGTLLAFIGAVLAFVASQLIESGDNTQATLEWARAHDVRAYVGILVDLSAVPFLLGAVVATWLTERGANARLATLGAVSLLVAYVAVAAKTGSQALAFRRRRMRTLT